MISVSVGVCAYNEEKNIEKALRAVLEQPLDGFSLKEVIVVSSASTDRTDAIVSEISRSDPRVTLVVQEKREGKTSAVNLFMSMAKGDVLVLANADNRIAPGGLQKLLEPFLDSKVGAVGGHPVPINSPDTQVGFTVHVLWEMHHQLSLIHPKLGELIAFRNLGVTIPPCQSTDEDYIRMAIEKKGYRVVYAPDAVVINRGPETLQDLWKQRVRVNIGETYMRSRYGYTVPTWDMRFLFPALINLVKMNKGNVHRLVGSMFLEGAIRIYSAVYVRMDKGDQTVWSMVTTTKKLE